MQSLRQKRYKIECPRCMSSRDVCYSEYRAKLQGKHTNYCKSCAAKLSNNLGRYKKGMQGYSHWSGKKISINTRIKMRDAHLRRVAEGKHNNYLGGREKENERIRKSMEYRLWREAVFCRDRYICQLVSCVHCKNKAGARNAGGLNADHIKPFCLYPELRFSVENGRTLCARAHKETETFGYKMLTHDDNGRFKLNI